MEQLINIWCQRYEICELDNLNGEILITKHKKLQKGRTILNKVVIGIKFKEAGKIYFFDPKGEKFQKGDYVIVETSIGEQYSEVIIPNKEIPDSKLVAPLKPIIRKANFKDKKHNEENQKKEKEAFNTAEKLIKKYKLDMNLTDVEYTFDNSKLLFYFTADGRIDFRDLVKELASIFKTRIELRQIGVRDEVRKIGGNGICGRELCCCTFLENFDTVSIKMAKEQNIALNAAKISGNCGRLMCCLKYEHEVYEDKLKKLPKVGATVKTEDGEGVVDGLETLKEKVRVKLRDGEGYFYKKYDAKDIKVIKDVVTKEEEIDEEEELKKLENDAQK